MKKQKTLRKILATLLLVVMVAMTLPVHAATPKGTITVTNIEAGAKVSVYKLATFNYDEYAEGSYQPKYPTYQWLDEVSNCLTGDYAKYANVTDKGADAFSALAEGNADIKGVYGFIANAIRTNADLKTAVSINETTSNDEGTATISDLDWGTYLILVEGVTKIYEPIVRNVGMKKEGESWVENTTETLDQSVTVKSVEVSIDKKVDDTAENIANGYDTTEAINYEIDILVPSYPANAISKKLEAFDIFPNSMELVNNSIKIYGLTDVNGTVEETTPEIASTAYTITKDVEKTFKKNDAEQTGTATFAVDFIYDNVATYKKIVIKYQAKLKPEATTVIYKDNKNEVYLNYSNNPYDSSDYKTKEDTETIVKTYGFNLKKVKEDNSTPIAGAKFAVKRSAEGARLKFKEISKGVYYLDEAGTVEELEVKDDGLLEVRGLKKGTYYYEETKAPTGYNKLPNVESITIGDTEPTEETATKVVNKTGFQLPVTGGMGTVIFTVSGIVLIAIGAVILVTINKKRNASK